MSTQLLIWNETKRTYYINFSLSSFYKILSKHLFLISESSKGPWCLVTNTTYSGRTRIGTVWNGTPYHWLGLELLLFQHGHTSSFSQFEPCVVATARAYFRSTFLRFFMLQYMHDTGYRVPRVPNPDKTGFFNSQGRDIRFFVVTLSLLREFWRPSIIYV